MFLSESFVRAGHFSPYGYVPTEWICALYVALFALSTMLHFGQALYFKLWWLLPTIVAGGLCELIGWSGRLWSSQSPLYIKPFLMQITTTIMGPSFLTAANFLMLGVIINRFGPQYSRLSPKVYSIVFITADCVALVIQAVGGGMASIAAQTGKGDPDKGARVMCGGIFWQLAAMTVYVILAVEFFVRVRRDRPIRVLPPGQQEDAEKEEIHPRGSLGFAHGSKLSLMIVALAMSTLFIYMRSIYRTIELLDGWTGRIITTEVYFNALDAVPITLAMYTINFLHPGWLLYGKRVLQTSMGQIDLDHLERA